MPAAADVTRKLKPSRHASDGPPLDNPLADTIVPTQACTLDKCCWWAAPLTHLSFSFSSKQDHKVSTCLQLRCGVGTPTICPCSGSPTIHCRRAKNPKSARAYTIDKSATAHTSAALPVMAPRLECRSNANDHQPSHHVPTGSLHNPADLPQS
jgi:hypothetical protein